MADPIPVRFRDEADARLSRVALRARMSKAELIRIAVDDFLDKVQATGQIVQTVILDAAADEPPPVPGQVNYAHSKPPPTTRLSEGNHLELRRAKSKRPKRAPEGNLPMAAESPEG